MKRALKTIVYCAIFGGLAMGLFGVLTTMDTAVNQPSTVAALVLAFLVAGAIGALMAGAIIGIPLAVIGILRGGASTRTQVTYHSPDGAGIAEHDAQAPLWVGAPGQLLETRATVLSVSPFSDPFAQRTARHLHWLRTPEGEVLRWLANDLRGLTSGDEIILRGTVKDHTWDSHGQPITEVWYYQTRRAPREHAPRLDDPPSEVSRTDGRHS